ncbi:MAG: hypothetical protein ACRCWN_01470, partial [Fusobacteriaceae bacterium]
MINRKKFFLIVVPLLIGVFIYIFFRSRHLFYYNFFHILNVDEDIREYRILLWKYRKSIPNWIIYSLPDGLWIYSFGIALLYGSQFFILDSLFFIGITIFMVGFEFFQMRFGGHGSLVGTFDLTDIYCFIGGSSLALLSSFFSVRTQRIYLFQKLKIYTL